LSLIRGRELLLVKYLIDLGKTHIRKEIIKKLEFVQPDIKFYINPDEQYSGGKSNKILIIHL
jgi:hypothetical protein